MRAERSTNLAGRRAAPRAAVAASGQAQWDRAILDFGLTGRVVWILGPSSPVVWDLAEAFLGEQAVIRVVTTRGSGWLQGRRLELRAGQDMRLATADAPCSLLSAALLSPLLDAGPPDVVLLVRTARPESDPSAHEWDQLLLSRAAQLPASGAVVVVTFDRATASGATEGGTEIEATRQSHRTWSALCVTAGAVSLIASTGGPMAALRTRKAHAAPHDNTLQGLSALAIFMATLGRGRIAMVSAEGSIAFV
jgi:hypothetical protein